MDKGEIAVLLIAIFQLRGWMNILALNKTGKNPVNRISINCKVKIIEIIPQY